MWKYLSFLLILFGSVKSFSQIQQAAIVLTDSLFVYENEDFQSQKILSITKYQVFLICEDNDDNSTWIKVDVPKNMLCKVTSDEYPFVTGFILKDKIIFLDSLQKFEGVKEIQLNFKLVERNSSFFKTENHQATYGYYPLLKKQTIIKKCS